MADERAGGGSGRPHQRKVERLTMLERAVREQPDSAFTHYNLANHLKILSDGLVHQSQATLYAARGADWGQDARVALAGLTERLGLTPCALS